MKLPVSVLVQFDLEVEENNIEKSVKDKLTAMLPGDFKFRIVKPKKQSSPNLIIGEFSLNDIFENLVNGNKRIVYTVDEKDYAVKLNVKRFTTFKNNNKCVACGLEGTKFLLEQCQDSETAHFNMYGVQNNQDILMTRDHVVPRSKGGGNTNENYATMCIICNNLKGDLELNPSQIGELRDILNNNLHLNRKQLNRLLSDAKQNMYIRDLK